MSVALFSASAQPAVSTQKKAESGKVEQVADTAATTAIKVPTKATKEVSPAKVLKNPQSYIGSCGGCASNPQFCCPANARPVCGDGGSCYCWEDTACR